MRALIRTRGALLVLIAGLALPGSARASTSETEAPVTEALATAARLSAAVASGEAVRALGSILSEQGVATEVSPATPGLAPPGTPVSLAGPLALLVGAVERAEALRSQALSRLSTADRSLLAGGGRLPTAAPPVPPPASGTGRVAAPASGAWAVEGAALAVLGRVDRHALARAAMTIVATIEAVAPHLPGGGAPAPSACGATGDMVFETSDCSVMVGGTGANGYPPPVAPTLLIDLGGDDVYTNDTAVGVGEVSVVVDVAGDDTYTVSRAASTPGPLVDLLAQGAGSLGVGVLADLGGDDVYSATVATTAPQPGPVARAARVIAQGAAVGGAGVLLDAGGEDRYEAITSSSGGAPASWGQGFGAAGVGALLDLSAPNAAAADRYTLRATSTLHEVTRTPSFAGFSIGAADAAGHGAAVIGAGALADAAGSDEYLALAEGGVSTVVAQGAAEVGAGALVDAAGDDVMAAIADGDTSLSLITTNPEVCWTVEVDVSTSSTSTIAQGAGVGGAGLLADGGGNDTRTALAHSRAEAITEASSSKVCSAVGGNNATASAHAGPGRIAAQGHAAIGAGVLVDLGGFDANRMEASSVARARAIATSPGLDTEHATATAEDAATDGQGFGAVGLGLSADVGGDDRYTSSATGSVEETTSAGTTTTPSPGTQRIQGWGDTGAGWLLDIEGTDTYTSDPPASAAANDSCWSNADDGRGRDLRLLALPPGGCP